MSVGLHAVTDPDEDLPSPPAPVAMFPAAAVEAYVKRVEAELASLRKEVKDLMRRLDAMKAAPAVAVDTHADTDPFAEFLDDLHGSGFSSPERLPKPTSGPSGNAE